MTTWDGRAAFYVTILDVTERKEQEQLIEHRSNYDLLTKLPNRNLFLDRLKQAITQTEKTEGMAAPSVSLPLKSFGPQEGLPQLGSTVLSLYRKSGHQSAAVETLGALLNAAVRTR